MAHSRKLIFVEREDGNFEETNEMTELYNSTVEKNNAFTVFGFRLEDLVVFPMAANIALITIYIILIVLALVNNTLTIYKSLFRKHRMLFKCFLISLAVSDIILAAVYGANNVPKFLLPAHNYWILGEKMCSFLPFLQGTALLANSIILTSIAVDRYVLVIHALNSTWDPSPWICSFCVVMVWLISAAISVPMYDMYFWAHGVIVKTVDGIPMVDQNYNAFNICIVDDKKVKNNYLLIVFILIVFPLLCSFVILNGIIAKQIWYIRKSFLRCPENEAGRATNMNTNIILYDNIATASKKNCTNKDNNLKNSKIYLKKHENKISVNSQQKSQCPACNCKRRNENATEHTGTNIQNNVARSSMPKSRKVRTFRIIMILIIMFLFLRSPSSIFVLISSSPNIHLVDTRWWIVQNVLGIFVVVNSILNPLFYCFSNSVISWYKFISSLFKRCFCALFCSCFSCDKMCKTRNSCNI